MSKLELADDDAAIVIRADRSVEGWMPETDGEVIEKNSTLYWASAVILMFGEGEDSRKMREILAEWFEMVVNE